MDIAQNVNYQGQATKFPSIAIWNRVEQALRGNLGGIILEDNFLSFNGSVTSNVGTYSSQAGGWLSYEDTGSTVATIETEVGGVLKITTDTTDNDEIWLQPGGAKQVIGKITSGDSGLLAYEIRVRPNQIVTQNAFFGLSEETLAAADTVSDAGAFASKDMIGFNLAEAASSTMTFAYRTAGQALTTPITALKTVVAATWYKFGFLYDAQAPTSKRIRVFVDGVEQSTYVTATNIAATAFPTGEELNLLMGLKNGAAAATRWDVDWVKVGFAF